MRTILLKSVRKALKAQASEQFVRNNIAGSSGIEQLMIARKLLYNVKPYVTAERYKKLVDFFEYTRKRKAIRHEFLEECRLESIYQI